ncbi:alpha/beta hydrolase-fold protein [Marivirga harenae]|uniref:alpha/beta hydrolase-fold protein n=1 Tax=Marivirga harenae TaxID=2010992 RepID=UPI0026DF3080|nr:alpha/beta hydrolase-fold protein [Marivirga harenae]WKV10598.1 alpha/beta hydrolase-fold protein [Marivirga harenae]
MKHYIYLLVLIASILMVNQPAIAQTTESQTEQFQNRIVDSIFSKTLSESRDFWVRLPDNFQPDNDEKYAVIYLMDGFSLESTLEAVYGNYWGHYLPHMILVGVSNRKNRTRDLTTSQLKMRRGSAFDYETGGAETFTKFMEEELIPYIDSKYPTMNYRTLIGHSHAGQFTINMLVNHAHLFQNYIAIDPTLDWDNQKLLKQAKDKFKTEDYNGKSLFVSLAAEMLHIQNESITIDNVMSDTSEFSLPARSIIEFSQLAKSQNQLNFSWKVYHEDLHGTVPLPTIRDGLIFLFQWYQFKSPQKFNNPETPIEELVSLLKEQEQIYTEHFGVPTAPMVDEMLNGYGYMNMQMGQPEKAFMFFEMNIKQNPNSANAYDSMAEYYESQNDKENALKYLNKAFELSGKDYYKERIEAVNKK